MARATPLRPLALKLVVILCPPKAPPATPVSFITHLPETVSRCSLHYADVEIDLDRLFLLQVVWQVLALGFEALRLP